MRGMKALSVLSVVGLVACSGPPPLEANQFRVGAAGGTFTHQGVSLAVPPGALSGDVVLTLAQTPAASVAPPPAGVTLPSTLVLLTPHGTVFSSPVTLRIPYAGRNQGRVALRLDDEADVTWERLDGVTFADNTATLETTRFSVIALGTGDYSVGGEVSGLSGTVVLQNLLGDDLTVTGDGPFVFSSTVLDGAPYSVTVRTQPSGQTCTVADGSGVAGAGPVVTIRVTCSANTWTVGGSVSGLTGTLGLRNNGGDDLLVFADGAFTFPLALTDGTPYAVTVFSQPPTQTCGVVDGGGTVAGADVTSVAVVCATNRYPVGGTVSGLVGSLVLQNNAGDDLTVSADGAFSFATPVDDGAPYAVTVLTQPARQTCIVTSGAGTIAGAAVTSVTVTCTTNTYAVGGTVSGLNGTVVLRNNGVDDLTLTSSAAFTFALAVADGSPYAVTVFSQPATQTCVVAQGTGTVNGAPVASVVVTCTTNTYQVSGLVAGLSGTVVLRNNGGDDLTVSANGPFSFATPIDDGAPYAVTVLSQPATQTCTVSGAAGTVAGADVGSVSVTCSVNTYTVGGTVSGLSGTLVLRNNAGDDLTRSSDGAFVFPAAVADGGAYAVTVFSQPAAQTCVVAGGAGTISGGAVSSVAVTCTTNTYAVGGTASGLNGAVVLRNSGADDLTVTNNGAFAFATPVADGATYAVTVLTQPATQTCVVTNGAGTVSGSAVTSPAVTCTTNTYAVGGTVSGLSGAVVLRNNGADDVTVTGDGAFAFATPVADGAAYAVTVSSPPATQTCTVAGGAGFVSGAAITSVSVTCVAAFSVGGTVSAYRAPIVLQLNGGDDLPVSSGGAFTFPGRLADAASWAVTVSSTPRDVHCAVANGSGSISTANVTDVDVACKAWVHPASFASYISPAGPKASNATLAVDSAGNAVVVWYQENVGASQRRILKSERRGGVWTHPASLADGISPLGSLALSPQVAMSDTGVTLIAWKQSNGTHDQVFLSEYRAGVWTHPAGLTSHVSFAGSAVGSFSLVMNASGDALLAWSQSDGATSRVYVSQFRLGAWTHPATVANAISPAGVAGQGPVAAIADNGDALVVWTHNDVVLRLLKSEFNAGAWTHPTSTADSFTLPGQHGFAPSVAMNASGDAVIAFVQNNGRAYMQYVSQRRLGTWVHPGALTQHISPDVGALQGAAAAVAIDDAGDAIVAWTHPDASFRYHALMSHYRAGVWTHPASVTDELGPVANMWVSQVAMNHLSEAVVMLTSYGNVYKAEYRGGVWTRALTTADRIHPAGANYAEWPQVAFDAQGRAVATWSCNETAPSSDRHVYISTYE